VVVQCKKEDMVCCFVEMVKGKRATLACAESCELLMESEDSWW
jgi:hypothetical protein